MDFISTVIDWAWVNILWLIGLIVAFAIPYLLYVISKNDMKPCMSLRSNTLISGLDNKYEKLELRYSDEPVKNFTITVIKFWNEGKQTINKTDVAEKDPIRIEVADNYRILDSKLLKTTDNRNNFQLLTGESEKSVLLTFDYVDKNDSVSIQVLHTGLSNDDIKLPGKIKGVNKIIDKSVDIGPSEKMFEAIAAENRLTRYVITGVLVLYPLIISGIFWYIRDNDTLFFLVAFVFAIITWGALYSGMKIGASKEL